MNDSTNSMEFKNRRNLKIELLCDSFEHNRTNNIFTISESSGNIKKSLKNGSCKKAEMACSSFPWNIMVVLPFKWIAYKDYKTHEKTYGNGSIFHIKCFYNIL